LLTYLGTVAYWKLDETEGIVVADSAGDNNGYGLGDPIWHPDGGLVDGALQLDGVDDYVITGAAPNPAVGDWAFGRCNFTATMTPKAGGEPIFTDGKALTLYKRQADGSWKLYWDCWNSNVPPAQWSNKPSWR